MPGSERAQRVRLDKVREAEERRLIEAAQRERAAFGDLYEKYFGLVYAYIARRTRSRDEAEDAVAEVFRKALANLPRYKYTGAPFAAWLFRIASNLLADRAKRGARDQNARTGDAETKPQSAKPNQQVELEKCEHAAHLFRLVEELVEDQRRVVMMRFAEEKSMKQIAAQLGRSEGAVKQLQFRALENLRRRLTSDEL